MYYFKLVTLLKFDFKMDVQNQPKSFKFQKRSFGAKKTEHRAFNSQWFQSHSWLHYEEVNCANLLFNITLSEVNKYWCL